jgi:hypothetical protein
LNPRQRRIASIIIHGVIEAMLDELPMVLLGLRSAGSLAHGRQMLANEGVGEGISF